MDDIKEFSSHVKILKEIKDKDGKIDFLNEAIEKDVNFIYVAFKHKLSFFDLSTLEEQYKFFYHIPYNSFIDNEWSNLAFQTKLDIEKLLELLVFYDAEFPIIDSDTLNTYWNQSKIS